MRRVFCAAVGAALLAATVGGKAQAVEIEYWQYFFEARVKAMDALIEKFQAENPGITVKHTHFPYADYRTKVAAAVSAGEGPDVVQLFYGWLNDYIEAELIQPLPASDFPVAEVEAEFFPMVQAMRRGDNYYALPTAVRSLALFWNTRLFEEAGLDPERGPESLDELVEFAKKIAKKDDAGNLTQVGITIGMTGQDHHWWREVLVRQFGGVPYGDDYTKVTYNNEAGEKALSFYTGLITQHGVTQVGFMDEAQAAFKAGRAGMHIDGSFRIGALDRTRGLKWNVGELPANADGKRFNFSSYWVNGITTKATGEKFDAAVKFLKFVSSPESMQLWLDVVGELPARPKVALTPENTAHPKYGPFIKGLDYANATKFANESAQRAVLVNMVDRVLLENQSMAESVDAAAAEEQKVLDEYYK